MKKTLKLLTVALIVFAISTAGIASASTIKTQVVDAMPSDTIFFVKFDPTHLGESFFELYNNFIIKDLVEDTVNNILSRGEFLNTSKISLKHSDEFVELDDFYNDYLSKTPLYIDIICDETEDCEDVLGVFAFKMSKDDYLKHASPILHRTFDVIEEGSSSGYFESLERISSYNDDLINDPMYVLYQNGTLYVTESKTLIEQIKEIGSGQTSESLGSSEEYKELKDNFLSDSSLDFYTNLREIPFLNPVSDEVLENIGMSKRVMDSLTDASYFVSAGDLSKNIEVTFGGSFYANLKKQLGFEFSKSEASLYKHLDVDSMLFVYDILDAKELANSVLEEVGEYADLAEADPLRITGEAVKEIVDEGANLYDWFGNESVVAVYDTGKLLPAITYMSEIGEDSEKVKSDVDSFIDELTKELESSADRNRFNSKFTFINDRGTLRVNIGKTDVQGDIIHKIELRYTLTDDSLALLNDNELIKNFSEDVLIGVVDGKLMISTDGDLKDHYSARAVSSPISEFIEDGAVGFEFMDFKNIETSILNFVSKIEPSSMTALVNNPGVVNSVTDAFNFMDYYTSSMTVKGDVLKADIMINIDYIKLFNLENNQLSAVSDVFERLSVLATTPVAFSDVGKDSEYYNDVSYLATIGIVNGYEDGTFNVDGSINRAEFTKLVVESLAKNEVIEWEYSYDSVFSDVPDYSWYVRYVIMASHNDLIHGYGDGTFHPEKNISRAEGAQIIKNVLDTFDISMDEVVELTDYDDVPDNVWYTPAVNLMTSYGFMSASSDNNFAPGERLTRGDAVRAIRGLYNLILSQE